jgi:hypothetical protein
LSLATVFSGQLVAQIGRQIPPDPAPMPCIGENSRWHRDSCLCSAYALADPFS